MFQYNNKVRITTVLQTIFSILNRANGKQNTIVCISEPSAGKNFFYDPILHFCLSVGYIANFNKYVSFPLQDCAGKRILCWNEPNCEPGAWDTIKMIFGGDTCPVRVKYMDDQQVTKTPVVVLSNREIFPKEEAFNCRIFRQQWRPCPALRSYDKKPHPLAVPKLFRKYKCLPPKLPTENDAYKNNEDKYYNSEDGF